MIRRVLVVDDEKNILVSLRGSLEDEGFVVETAENGHVALERMRKFAPDVVLLDIWMPGEDGISILEKIRKWDPLTDVVMMSGHGTIETAVKALKLGAYDFLEKPLHFEKLLILLNHAFELRNLKRENRFLREELDGEEGITGRSAAAKKLIGLIQQAGPSNGWVLIQGERGTGKELVARVLHQGSERATGRFVSVHCGLLNDADVEKTLFGYEKGAFGGATARRIGRLEQADGGTLFLDDLANMSPFFQEKILDFIKTGRFKRVGGEVEIEVDVRVISATDRPLRPLVEKDEFRKDLYLSLNVIPIVVPPLRSRKLDIPALVDQFLSRYSKGPKKKVDRATLKLLQKYYWPGNVRELKNWVERACILTPTPVISSRGVDEERPTDILKFEDRSLRLAKVDFERKFLLHLLDENKGNVGKAAQKLGMESPMLQKKLKSYKITPSERNL